MQKITTCLWFDDQAEDAANLYTSIFKDSSIGHISRYPPEGAAIAGKEPGSAMTVSFTIEGHDFLALNGGPKHKMNPSISFTAQTKTPDEAEALWEKLLDGGMAMMALGKYEWSEKYGFLQDKFGVSWQIYTARAAPIRQRISPSLMFTNKQCGRAEEAINFYASVFKDSEVHGIMKYGPDDIDREGWVKHARFAINNTVLMAMDSSAPHEFAFNEAISLVINCETQEEIDYYWEKLTADGGEESMCGWLKDKFGVSWQVNPVILGKLLGGPDAEGAKRATQAMFGMKKFDIAALKRAYAGE